jgi:hypothetical protein
MLGSFRTTRIPPTHIAKLGHYQKPRPCAAAEVYICQGSRLWRAGEFQHAFPCLLHHLLYAWNHLIELLFGLL